VAARGTGSPPSKSEPHATSARDPRALLHSLFIRGALASRSIAAHGERRCVEIIDCAWESSEPECSRSPVRRPVPSWQRPCFKARRVPTGVESSLRRRGAGGFRVSGVRSKSAATFPAAITTGIQATGIVTTIITTGTRVIGTITIRTTVIKSTRDSS